MCRLTAVLSTRQPMLIGDIVTRPKLSIIYQSFNCRERLHRDEQPRWAYEKSTLNGDGFGVGWYVPKLWNRKMIAALDDKEPCLFRSLKPAWSDRNLKSIAEKTASNLIFAHVRAAGPGSGDPTESNCHPFVCGRFMFMHNGLIGGDWSLIRRRLLKRLRTSVAFDFALDHTPIDTVVVFALFIDQLERGPMADYTPNELRHCLEAAIQIIEEVLEEVDAQQNSYLNVVVTDGSTILGSRYVCERTGPSESLSLYFASGTRWVVPEGQEDYTMIQTDKRHEVCIITSEPLTDIRSEWVPVPHNHLIIVTSKCDVLLQPIQRNSQSENAENFCRALSNTCLASANRSDPRNFSLTVSLKQMTGSNGLSDSPRSRTNMLDYANEAVALGILGKNASCDNSPAAFCCTRLIKSCGQLSSSADAVMCVLYVEYAGQKLLVSGSSDGYICVWSDGQLLRRHMGHTRSVLALSVYNQEWLITGSSDSTVALWRFEQLLNPNVSCPCCIIACRITFEPIQGDILSMYVMSDVDESSCLYFGTQSTSVGAIRLCSLLERLEKCQCFKPVDSHATEECCSLKPFVTAGWHAIPELQLNVLRRESLRLESLKQPDQKQCADIDWSFLDHNSLGHCGFVACVTKVRDYLVTGGGDGLIMVWKDGKPEQFLTGHTGAVLCLASKNDDEAILYSGSRDRTVRVWDLDTMSCIQILRGHSADVLSLCVTDDLIISASTTADILGWHARWHQVAVKFIPHFDETVTPAEAPVVTELTMLGDTYLCAACGDGRIRMWNLEEYSASLEPLREREVSICNWDVEQVLKTLVAFPTVSSDPKHLSDCWHAAKAISEILDAIGCSTSIINIKTDVPPLVMGQLGNDPTKPTVLLYSHYDVVGGGDAASWSLKTPFELQTFNGYYYGRGTTDNKGPLVAQMLAIKELKNTADLPCNVVFVSEGAEEIGSPGFDGFVAEYLTTIFPRIDYAILCNAYWIDDTHPCLVYGMRGLVDFSLTLSTSAEVTTGLHSGIHGGAIPEVVRDLMSMLAKGLDAIEKDPLFRREIRIDPASLDIIESLCSNDVVTIDKYITETGLRVSKYDNPATMLRKRWLEPSVSVTNITTSNGCSCSGDSFHVVPISVTADVSLRTVPNQSISTIQDLVERTFPQDTRASAELKLEWRRLQDWWLEDRTSSLYKAAHAAIKHVYDQDPLYICEGGSIPVCQKLQNILKIPTLQLPLGASSDHAHLPDERIRTNNLTNGVGVLMKMLTTLAEHHRP